MDNNLLLKTSDIPCSKFVKQFINMHSSSLGISYPELEKNNILINLLYNQFMSYSKDELVSSDPRNHLFSHILNLKSKYLFSAYLQKNITENLLDESKWILNQANKVSDKDKFYNLIYNIEYEHYNKQKNYSNQNRQYHIEHNFLSNMIELFSPKYNSIHESFVIEYYEKYKNDILPFFITGLFNKSYPLIYTENSIDFADYLISLYKKDNFEEIINCNLNAALPIFSSHNEKFWLSSTEINQINRFLKLGIKFDSTKYKFNNLSLISCVSIEQNDNISKTILPNMKSIVPFKDTPEDWQTQDNNVEMFGSEFVKKWYAKEKLQLHLNNTNTSEVHNILKPKI